MALRQNERFGTLSVIVDVGEIGTNIKTVDASAAETNPMAVVAPSVVAFAVTRVGGFEGPHFACLLVSHPQVRFLVVDGEVAAPLAVIDEPTSIGRFAWIVEAEAVAGVEQRVDLLAEGSRFGIEADGAYAEMYFLIFLRHGFDDGSRAVVERLAIGRESWPGLPVTG